MKYILSSDLLFNLNILQDSDSAYESSYYSPQDQKFLSTPKSLDPQHSESGLADSSLNQQQSQQQHHNSDATPELVYSGNTQSDHARQVIYNSPFGADLKISHSNNTSTNYADQEIGNLNSGRKSKNPLLTVVGKIRGALSTENNRADNEAVQRLFAPTDPNMNVTYVGNISENGGIQHLGMDVGMDLPAHKFKRGKKSGKLTN